MYQRAMIHVVPPRRSCQQPYHRWARHARTRTTQVIRTHRTVRALAIGNTSRHFIDVTFMSNAFWNPWEQIFKVYFNGYVSSGLLHSSTSFIDRQLTKRRRDQYTDIDSLNPNSSEIHALENDEEVAEGESASMENRANRGAQSWNQLRAVVRYYCSLRKIKRQ